MVGGSAKLRKVNERNVRLPTLTESSKTQPLIKRPREPEAFTPAAGGEGGLGPGLKIGETIRLKNEKKN